MKQILSARPILLSLLALLTTCYSMPLFALLEIEITKSADSALPIAIVPFTSEPNIDLDLAAVVASDLERSGQFKAIPTKDMLTLPGLNDKINYQNWRIIGVENLVVGEIKPTADGQYTVAFRLIDVFKQQQLGGDSRPVAASELRNHAHRISDMIYEMITGERGAFSTRIAYVSVTRAGKALRYRLETADTDGHNIRVLRESAEPIMSPSWSPDARHLAYVSFENGRSQVFIHNVFDDSRETIDRLNQFKGINGAPVWSGDGRRLALTLSKGSNPDIYVYDLSSRQLQQVTKNWAIDTEPAWMPNGKALVFTSGRSGNPQLYRVNLGGQQRPVRITFEGKYNASPSVSPDGRSVALVHANRGRYQIAVLDLKTGLFRVLTDGQLDESPSFAPNGSMLLYASQQGKQGVLAAVSVDGRTRQRLAFSEGHIREPTWAPFTD